MTNFLRNFFKLYPENNFYKLDADKDYTKDELINILKNEDLSIGSGNAIVLFLIESMYKEIEELKNK